MLISEQLKTAGGKTHYYPRRFYFMTLTYEDLESLPVGDLQFIRIIAINRLYVLQNSNDTDAIARWTVIEANCTQLLKTYHNHGSNQDQKNEI